MPDNNNRWHRQEEPRQQTAAAAPEDAPDILPPQSQLQVTVAPAATNKEQPALPLRDTDSMSAQTERASNSQADVADMRCNDSISTAASARAHPATPTQKQPPDTTPQTGQQGHARARSDGGGAAHGTVYPT